MYGLNEESTNVPIAGYREQYAWLAQQLRELGADAVFLQPTPDIGIPVTEAQRKPDSNAPPYIARTLGFGEALRPLAREMKVPLATTFSALWGNGGATLEESAHSQWPIFPTGYSQQFSSMLETDGKGDTIHPNVLGHLQIARAIFDALNDVPEPALWQWTARTRWTPRGAESTLSARNVSKSRRVRRLQVVPPSDAVLESAPVAYDLAPGQSAHLSVLWTQAQKPEDLLEYPLDRHLSLQVPLVPVVDYSNNAGKISSRVHGISAPFEALAALRRTRQVVNGNRVTVDYSVDGKQRNLPVQIPANREVGRIPIVQKVQAKNATGWLTGEVAYVRYGVARADDKAAEAKLEFRASCARSTERKRCALSRPIGYEDAVGRDDRKQLEATLFGFGCLCFIGCRQDHRPRRPG